MNMLEEMTLVYIDLRPQAEIGKFKEQTNAQGGCAAGQDGVDHWLVV